MTEQAPDDPDRRPTQAELDAEDLARMSRTSRDKDEAELYPRPLADPGQPPRALAVHARVAYWGAACAGLMCLIYSIVQAGAISAAMRTRLLADAATSSAANSDGTNGAAGTAAGQPIADQIDTFATVLPIIGMVVLVLFLVGEYLTLTATATHHSRNARSFFLTLVVLNLMCIPVGLDLFFDYPELWSGVIVFGWVQFGLLVVAAVMTLRRAVDRWLPEPTRLRPTRMLRTR